MNGHIWQATCDAELTNTKQCVSRKNYNKGAVWDQNLYRTSVQSVRALILVQIISEKPLSLISGRSYLMTARRWRVDFLPEMWLSMVKISWKVWKFPEKVYFVQGKISWKVTYLFYFGLSRYPSMVYHCATSAEASLSQLLRNIQSHEGRQISRNEVL